MYKCVHDVLPFSTANRHHRSGRNGCLNIESRKCTQQVTPNRLLTPIELHGVTDTNTVNLHFQLREDIKPHTLP